MPIDIKCDGLPITLRQVKELWRETVKYRGHADDTVSVRCVSAAEITDLNTRYRNKSKATNVLTFSYGEGEHDIALSLEVAEKEAAARNVGIDDYTALLLVHAFLHATGLDHEISKEEEEKMKQAEKTILKKIGFTVNNL